MQTNPAVEQSKIVRWFASPWNQSGRKGKGLWMKGFAEKPRVCDAFSVADDTQCHGCHVQASDDRLEVSAWTGATVRTAMLLPSSDIIIIIIFV